MPQSEGTVFAGIETGLFARGWGHVQLKELWGPCLRKSYGPWDSGLGVPRKPLQGIVRQKPAVIE